jgi:3-oxoacyl-[acyl-carrier-protein] synthase-3
MYAPSGVLTNADLERMVDTSDEWIMTRTGIRERRVAGPDETTATMGALAAKRALAVADVDPAEVGMILLATCTPDYQLPSTASFVKEAIGATRAAAMDVAAACSGFVYGFATATAMVQSGMYRHVLVIGSELLSRFLDFTDRSTCILFGDGAGAVLVSASEEPSGGMLASELTTDPTGTYLIWVPSGGSASPPSEQTVARGEHYIRMNGSETYRYATKTLASTALVAIERAGLTTDDIALFVPHQANLRIIKFVAGSMGIEMDRVFVNVDRYGNTSAASVPIALAEAVDTGRVKVGDNLVFVAFGAGFTSGAAVLQWTADPANGARARSAAPNAEIHMPPEWRPAMPVPAALRDIVERNGRGPMPPDGTTASEPARPEPASTEPASAEPAATPGR